MLAILPKITEKVPVIQIFSNDYYSYVHAILSPIVISASVKHVWMIFEIYLDRALINFQALRSTKYIVGYRKCKKRWTESFANIQTRCTTTNRFVARSIFVR